MAKKKEENAAAVETEEMKAKFREKLAEILELGKKKRNILEYQERISRKSRIAMALLSISMTKSTTSIWQR